MLALLLPLACTTPAPTPPVASPAAPPAEAPAPPAAPEWTVTPTLLRYEGGVVTMSVQVEHAPHAAGEAPPAEPEETWLGATVLTTAGEEIDLSVQTVFPHQITEPFTFSSEVGEDVEVVIVGLWGKKIEPCDSTRSGCRMFGFVLDESLAAWPEETYVATSPRRQRFLPASMDVEVSTPADLPEAAKGAITAAVYTFGAVEEARFGTKMETAYAPAAGGLGSAVLHKHVHDGPLASRLAEALAEVSGKDVPVRHEPEATADLVVRYGTCAGEPCR